MKKFNNKTVLITGTSKGIGKTLCNAFLQEEASVLSMSRSGCDIEHPNFTDFSVDITNIKKVEEIINSYKNKIDILVNNAGIIHRAPLFETSREEIENVFNVNFTSTFLLSKSIAKIMKKNGGGVIVNTLSFASFIPSANTGIYAASKAALASLTRTMAAEWAPYNIRVNGYSPGVIETEMTKPAIEKDKQGLINAVSLHRLGQTEEMAKVVLFLASNESSFINGANIDASGGKFIVQSPEKVWQSKV